ncbi:SET domain-containing protein [Favolaschia claudopus]|uniref:SET domain-containing protein n=1 Tax=Favolaschia claudopus TaxID=2862362 RepID=A0AAW0E1K7_9AGAR
MFPAGRGTPPLVWLLAVILFFHLATFTTASPTTRHLISRYNSNNDDVLLPRAFTVNNSTGTVEVFDGSGNLIAQSPATDGSGSNFDLPALVWIGFSLVIGLPMSCAGIRGWRLSTGIGIGLAAAMASWAAIINTVGGSGVADLFLNAIIIVFFICGFALGVFEIGRLGGITMIGVTGGMAFGIRVVLLRAGLLLSSPGLFAINWVIVGICAAAGGLSLIWFQRYGLLFGCASIGTFLTALGVDLIMSKQQGMSAGLRFLFDRNDSHVAFLLANPYTAPIRSRILIIASLALIPILAIAQHRFFPQPFTRRPTVSDDILAVNYPTVEIVDTKRKTFLMDLWDGVRHKPDSVNRFSV